MNKKLLGIAAVALLGVSAAFAATTSTVYFTASGTLTKYLAPLDPTNEQDKQSGESDHSSEKAVGVSKVFTTIGTSGVDTVRAVSKGETLTSGSIGVKYSKNGKTANPCTDSTFVANNPYIYHEIYISGMQFSKAEDYYIIPIRIANFDSVSHFISGVTKQSQSYYTSGSETRTYLYSDYTSLTVTDASNKETTSSLLQYGYVRDCINNKEMYVKDFSSLDSETPSSESASDYVNSENTRLYYLQIKLTADYTGSDLTFNSARILLAFE